MSSPKCLDNRIFGSLSRILPPQGRETPSLWLKSKFSPVTIFTLLNCALNYFQIRIPP